MWEVNFNFASNLAKSNREILKKLQTVDFFCIYFGSGEKCFDFYVESKCIRLLQTIWDKLILNRLFVSKLKKI